MESEPCSLLRKKAVSGHTWQSLLCLRPCRQKKKVAYTSYMHRLRNQTWCTRASCLAAAAFPWMDSPRLLGAVALESARLCRCSRRGRLSPREVLLAMKLVLLRELSRSLPGSSSAGCC